MIKITDNCRFPIGQTNQMLAFKKTIVTRNQNRSSIKTGEWFQAVKNEEILEETFIIEHDWRKLQNILHSFGKLRFQIQDKNETPWFTKE